MMTTIEVPALREWLEAGRDVTVLDVRTDDDRAQWRIPGSLHVNAYDDLKSGSPGALAAIDLPRDRPVVTVCSAGRVSRLAAEHLAIRGYDARSLEGGMKAWSLAWNVAAVPTGDPVTTVVQLRRTGKGCLSYLVASEGSAAVIDPSLPEAVYLSVADARGWTIAHVVDTHIHADHLSRARRLADRAAARLWLPAQERTRFPHDGIADGGIIHVGASRLTAIHTPGHTWESTALRLNASALFTGDTLFANGVGRPDLHAAVGQASGRARALFASLQRLRQLPGDTLVLPGHHSSPIPFDGEPIVSRMADVERWLADWLSSEEAFVARVTPGLPPPDNFVQITALNERGEWPDVDAAELEAGANRCAVT